MGLIEKTTTQVYEKRHLDVSGLTEEEKKEVRKEIKDGGWFIEYGSPEAKIIYRRKRSK